MSMDHSLLRIVSRICKHSGKDAAEDPIAAHEQDAMFVCAHELLVEEEEPYLLE